MKKIGIALAILAGIAPALAFAQGSGSGVRIRIIYHMDANFSSPVGEFVEFCDGSHTWNGDLTEHGQYFLYDC